MLTRLTVAPAEKAVRSEIADLFAAARSFDTAPQPEPVEWPSPPTLRAASSRATEERHRGAVGVLANGATLRSSSAVQHTPGSTELALDRLSARGEVSAEFNAARFTELANAAALPSPIPQNEFFGERACEPTWREEDGPVIVLERLRLLARRFLFWRVAVWLPKQNKQLLRSVSADAAWATQRAAWHAWRRHARNERLVFAQSERLRRSVWAVLSAWQVWASARHEVRQAVSVEVSRLDEELRSARELIQATQLEVSLVRQVGEEREGVLRVDIEQRESALRLELEQQSAALETQKQFAASTIDELSTALETVTGQLTEVHRERDVAVANAEASLSAGRARELRDRDTRPRRLRTQSGGISGGLPSSTPTSLSSAVMSEQPGLAAAVPMLPEAAKAEVDAAKASKHDEFFY